ncbi:uncharacterized protein LOC128882640 isoform X2 [Hylaeus volcanicus]|uniref:uncharacterized protein LOC128882640 isoform X2 n=1 Tax=Hylaeus volcanicus TaxID=313075 RepID=UPI0023B81865|nr:uncharacterized protein LOC128882640 isoform X2 [Hylaeus volcanicus]
MNYLVIIILSISSFFIKREDLIRCIDEDILQFISKGQDVIAGISKYLSDLVDKNPKAPFGVMVLDENFFELSMSSNNLNPSLFLKKSTDSVDKFWEVFMNNNGVTSPSKKNFLVLPGQLGILLLMSFQQVMCEATRLSENFDSYSIEERVKYFTFLQNIYNRNIQSVSENKNLVQLKTSIFCLNRQLFMLNDNECLRVADKMKPLISPHDGLFIFKDCFDLKMQKVIQEFIRAVKSSNSHCSQLLMDQLHFSFNFIEKFQNEAIDDPSLIENLLKSGYKFRMELHRNLLYEKNHNSKDFKKTNKKKYSLKKKNLFEKSGDMDEPTEANTKNSLKPESKKKKKSFLQNIFSLIKKKSQVGNQIKDISISKKGSSQSGYSKLLDTSDVDHTNDPSTSKSITNAGFSFEPSNYLSRESLTNTRDTDSNSDSSFDVPSFSYNNFLHEKKLKEKSFPVQENVVTIQGSPNLARRNVQSKDRKIVLSNLGSLNGNEILNKKSNDETKSSILQHTHKRSPIYPHHKQE